jgi:hypothetical protein
VTETPVTLAGRTFTRIDYGDGDDDYLLAEDDMIRIIETADADLPPRRRRACPEAAANRSPGLGQPTRTGTDRTRGPYFSVQGWQCRPNRPSADRTLGEGPWANLVAWAEDCVVRGEVEPATAA